MMDFPVKFYDFCWKVGIKSQQFWGGLRFLHSFHSLAASHVSDALVNPAVQVLDELAFLFFLQKVSCKKVSYTFC